MWHVLGQLGCFSSLKVDSLLHAEGIPLAEDVRAGKVAGKVERRQEAERFAGVPTCSRHCSAAGRTRRSWREMDGPEPRKTARPQVSEGSRRPEGLAVVLVEKTLYARTSARSVAKVRMRAR